jgi:hypothetical protein
MLHTRDTEENPEGGGGFAGDELFEVAEHEKLPAVRPQPFEGGADAVAEFVLQESLAGVRDRRDGLVGEADHRIRRARHRRAPVHGARNGSWRSRTAGGLCDW